MSAGFRVRNGAIFGRSGASLDDIRLDVPGYGITVIVGVAGSGKSALLQALTGGVLPPGWSTQGKWSACGVELPVPDELPIAFPLLRPFSGPPSTAVQQSAEHPWDLIARLAGVIGLDCPDAVVPVAKLTELATALLALRGRGMALLTTADPSLARAVADRIIFLSGTRVHYEGPAATFFRQPPPTAVSFLQHRRPRPAFGRSQLPHHFRWVIPERLGTMQYPGTGQSLEEELRALNSNGIASLVNLGENNLPQKHLRAFAISGWHFPILRYGAPRLDDTRDLCLRLDEQFAKSRGVALHCSDGQGRCGLIAACYLVWSGDSWEDARDRIRSVGDELMVNSLHIEFVRRFADYVHRSRLRPPPESRAVPSLKRD